MRNARRRHRPWASSRAWATTSPRSSPPACARAARASASTRTTPNAACAARSAAARRWIWKATLDRRTLRFMGDAAAYAYLAMQQAMAQAGPRRRGRGLAPAHRPGRRLRRRLQPQPGGAADTLRAQGHQARRPVHGDTHHGQHRLGLPGHAVRHQGRQLLDHLGLRDQRALHRPRRAADRLGQAGRGVRRRRRGGELGAVGAVRRHGRDVQRLQRPARAGLARLRRGARRLRHRRRRRHAGAGGARACQARGAAILAELVGYGATSDGYDMVAPSGEGAVRCMRQALETVRTAGRLHQRARHLDAGRRRWPS
jgi:3-oxoacyl-[acyl-carrier-protein] synthase-1